MKTREFILQSRLDAQALEAWVEAGWLLPRQDGATRDFSEIDLARAQLIHDLGRLGANDEAIPVILDLIDQVHGLRRTLRDLLSALHAQPEAMRRWVMADLRTAELNRPDDDAAGMPSSDEDQDR
jgi:chaperone modulatory protein CbpM